MYSTCLHCTKPLGTNDEIEWLKKIAQMRMIGKVSFLCVDTFLLQKLQRIFIDVHRSNICICR